MFRFSLKSLFLATFAVAVGSAALAYPTPVVSRWTFSIAMLVLALASVVAVVGQGRACLFCRGFAILGWIYFVMVFMPTDYVRFRVSPNGGPIRQLLLTHEALVQLHHLLDRDNVRFRLDANYEPADFLRIGHTLWLLLLAFVGGLTSCLVSGRNKAEGDAN